MRTRLRHIQQRLRSWLAHPDVLETLEFCRFLWQGAGWLLGRPAVRRRGFLLALLLGVFLFPLPLDSMPTQSFFQGQRGINAAPGGKIYFIFFARDDKYSFAHVAHTIRQEIMAGPAFSPGADNIVYRQLETTRDMEEHWAYVDSLSRALGQEVEEGHLITHGHIKGGTGRISQLKPVKNGIVIPWAGATFGHDEVARLKKLNWSGSSSLTLYACRSGLSRGGPGSSLAEAFLAGQDVKTVLGQSGWTDFSYSKEHYVRIYSYRGDYRPTYLWTYGRGVNKRVSNKLDAPPGCEEWGTRWAAVAFSRENNNNSDIRRDYVTER